MHGATLTLSAVQLGSIALAAAALALAAWHDLRAYLIPNRFAAMIALAFLVFVAGGGWREAAFGLATGAAVLALGIFCFARGWFGGGDAKLIAATALWAAPPLFSTFAMVTAMSGATLALAMLTPLRGWLPSPPAELAPAAGAAALRQPIPFGVAIAAGGLFLLLRRATG